MSLDDLYFAIQVKKCIEFNHNNLTYHIVYDKDSEGKDIIKFGPLYDEQVFYSYGELVNNAKVENYHLKNFIENL